MDRDPYFSGLKLFDALAVVLSVVTAVDVSTQDVVLGYGLGAGATIQFAVAGGFIIKAVS